jgi:hypothetical protein
MLVWEPFGPSQGQLTAGLLSGSLKPVAVIVVIVGVGDFQKRRKLAAGSDLC